MIEFRAQLAEALALLPRQQRSVLVLRHFDGLSDTEIATLLGCSTSTVRSAASRGLTRLRHALDPELLTDTMVREREIQ
jgi:RNA polymerase sigma factor (sigma-70 family)